MSSSKDIKIGGWTISAQTKELKVKEVIVKSTIDCAQRKNYLQINLIFILNVGKERL